MATPVLTNPHAYTIVSGPAEPLLDVVQQQEGEGDPSRMRNQLRYQEILKIYQGYAEQYPNPLLVRERLERDRLLQEVRMELIEQRKQSEEEEAITEVVETKTPLPKQNGFFSFFRFFTSKEKVNSTLIPDIDIREEDYLQYSTITKNDHEDTLCGTQSVLDPTCIPQEAHSMARFYLSSPTNPIIVHQSNPQTSGRILLLISVGVIAELIHNTWEVKHTSDKQHWEKQKLSKQDFQLSRATMIGEDCLAISWGGLPDTILYRRGNEWNALAVFLPSPAVVDHWRSRGQQVFENYDLLRVTDVNVLMVDTGNDTIATTLVVSRLGAYLELVPIPDSIWRNNLPKKLKQKGLIPLTPENCNIAPLSLTEQLDDLLHLEVIRTDVGLHTKWDDSNEHPPAEYLLAASGSKNGREHITFWAVATLLLEKTGEPFSLHADFLAESSPIGPPWDFTVFANKAIFEYWRLPRRVARKVNVSGFEQQDSTTSQPSTGTLSAPVPITSMRFKKSGKQLWLCGLDWYGGASIMDCTSTLEIASKSRSSNSHQSFQVPTVVSQGQIQNAIGQQNIVDISWSHRGDLICSVSGRKIIILSIDANGSKKLIKRLLALPSWMNNNGRLIKMNEDICLLLPRKSTLVTAILKPSDSETVSLSHKRLWQQTHKLSNLSSIPDNVYIIEQVAEIFYGRLEVENLDLSFCREACELASEKLRTLSMTSALKLREDIESLNGKFKAWSFRIHTYSLLCEHLNVEENAVSMIQKFIHEPLYDLTLQFAKKGDIKGLDLLLGRHSKELSQSLQSILEAIPVTVEFSQYSHLIVADAESEDDHSGILTTKMDWTAMRDRESETILGSRPHDENSLVQYALSLLDGQETEKQINTQSVPHFCEQLSACAAIARESRSSLPKSERMIPSMRCLMKLFVAVFERVILHCRKLDLQQSNARYLINELWAYYESLPAVLAPHESEDEEIINIQTKIDMIYRNLVAADILSYWEPNSTFTYLSVEEVRGNEIVSTLCYTFQQKISSKYLVFEFKRKFTREFATDLFQLSQDACQSIMIVELQLFDNLIPELLHKGEFEIIGEIFSTRLNEIISCEKVEPTVVNYVNELLEEDSNQSPEANKDRIEKIIRCQDILSAFFPRLKKVLEGMRKHLDAAHFLQSVLNPDGKNPSPSELRNTFPLDVIELVLRENPICILQGSPDWDDQSFAFDKNRELVSIYLRRKDHGAESASLPSTPGGGLLRLADIVGLDSKFASLIVRHRIAHHACQVSMPWISAAVAIAMLDENERSPEATELIIITISGIVEMEDFNDVAMKVFLCQEAIQMAPDHKFPHLSRIIDVFGRLEHKNSRFCPASWNNQSLTKKSKDNSQGGDFLLFRAVGMLANAEINQDIDTLNSDYFFNRNLKPRLIDRLFQDTLGQYSTDLNQLFQILQDKSSRCERDDPLLIAIGRFTMFWCISNSVRLIDHDNDGSFDHADALENLALATSLFLHTFNKESVKADIEEIASIAAEQSLEAMEQSALIQRPAPIRPDLTIVRKLMGLGYSENGSRRAAAATSNESQQAALAWAVAHSFDPSFNLPMIFVKWPSPQVNMKLINDLKLCLEHIRSATLRNALIKPTHLPRQLKFSANKVINTKSEQAIMSVANSIQQNSYSATMAPPRNDFKDEVQYTRSGDTEHNRSETDGNVEFLSSKAKTISATCESETNEISPDHSVASDSFSFPDEFPDIIPTKNSNPAGNKISQLPSHVTLNDARLSFQSDKAESPNNHDTRPHNDSKKMSNKEQQLSFQRDVTPQVKTPITSICSIPKEASEANTALSKISDKPVGPPVTQIPPTESGPRPPRTIPQGRPPPPPPRPPPTPPPLPSRVMTSSSKETNERSVSVETSSQSKVMETPSDISKISRSSDVRNGGPPPSTQSRASVVRHDHSKAVLSPPPPPPAPPPPPPPRPLTSLLIDRSTLRRAGEEVRQTSRGLNNRLDDNERKRLLSKGRELFHRSRNSPNKSPLNVGFGSIGLQSNREQRSEGMSPMNLMEPKKLMTGKFSSLTPDDTVDDEPDGWDFEDFE